MGVHLPSPEHLAFMMDVKAAMSKHSGLSGPELLALTSQLVGNLIALQDQTKYSPGSVMEMVASNIEIGNRTAIDTFLGSTQGNG